MLPVVLVAMFMAQFDLYVVNVALPVLQHELDASQASLELIVGGYAFTYAAGLITGGRLGDHYGHRNVFLIGMLLFGVASLLCGVAQTSAQLVAFRLIQGATAAILVPQVLALITRAFPPVERSRALSWFGVTMGVGAVAGQVLGGVLLNVDILGLGWRVIFVVNVPIAVVTVLLGLRILPHHVATGPASFDVLGAMGITASLTSILVPLVMGRSEHWAPWTWICLALSIPLLLVTVVRERRLEHHGGRPIIPLSLFTERAFNLGLGTSIALFASFFSVVFTLTLVMQNGLGISPLMAGLTFAPLGMAFAVASVLAKKQIVQHGPVVIAVGTAIVILGLTALIIVAYGVDVRLSAPMLIGPMILIGFGNGVAVPALIGVVLTTISPQHAGSAAGVLTTAQQFSSAIGIAAIGTVFFAVLGPGKRAGVHAYATALAGASMCSVVLALVGAVMTILLVRIPKRASIDG
ncbi:MFS transporter [Williamsia sterculiae]|nr:MFS transporter [Williamsia sterculiae]